MSTLLLWIRLALTCAVIGIPVYYILQQFVRLFHTTSHHLQEQISLAKANIRQYPDNNVYEEEFLYPTQDEDDAEYNQARNIEDETKSVLQQTSHEPQETQQDWTTTPEDESDTVLVTNETPQQSPSQDSQSNNQALSWYSAEKLAQTVEDIKYAALTYKERGKKDEYEKKLIEGIALVGDHEEFLIMLADHYFEAEQYVRASTLLKKIIQLNPANHRAIRQLGQIYLHNNDKETAKLLLEKARDLKDDNPKYLISLVDMYYEEKNMKECISLVEKLSKLRPTNIDYLLTLWNLHEEINQPTKAHSFYMKVLEINPTNDEAKKAIKRLL